MNSININNTKTKSLCKNSGNVLLCIFSEKFMDQVNILPLSKLSLYLLFTFLFGKNFRCVACKLLDSDWLMIIA